MAYFLGSPLFVVVVLAVLLVTVGVPLLRVLLIYSGVVARRPRDASMLGLKPAPAVLPLIEALGRAGFQRPRTTSSDCMSTAGGGARGCQ